MNKIKNLSLQTVLTLLFFFVSTFIYPFQIYIHGASTENNIALQKNTTNIPFVKNISSLFSDVRQSPTKNIRIAILDSGVDAEHPELSKYLWKNTSEEKGIYGVDDDNNGFIDDYFGWNFLENNNHINDDDGHGTHVSGIISSANKEQEISLISLKISQSSEDIRVSHVLSALEYARDQKVDIVNMSFGFSKPSYKLHQLLKKMKEEGIFLIASSGNANGEQKYYPSEYSEVFSVGHSDITGLRMEEKNSKSKVDAYFPGSFLSTLPGNMYGQRTGSSQSSAFAVYLAAKIIVHFPSFSQEQVATLLRQYSASFSQKFKEYYGSSRRRKIPFLTVDQLGVILLREFNNQEKVLRVLRKEYRKLFPLLPNANQLFQWILGKPKIHFVHRRDVPGMIQELKSDMSENLHPSASENFFPLITSQEFLHFLR